MRRSTALVRLTLALLAALIGIGVYLYTERSTTEYFAQKQAILKKFQKLQEAYQRLENDLLKSRSDFGIDPSVLHDDLNTFDIQLKQLYASPFLLRPFYTDTYLQINQIGRDFEKYRMDVERLTTLQQGLHQYFKALNDLKEEFSRYFPTDQQKNEVKETRERLQSLLTAITLLSSNANYDPKPLIQEAIRLKSQAEKGLDPSQKQFFQRLLEDLKKVQYSQKNYRGQIERLLKNPLGNKIRLLQKTFQKNAQQELMDLNETNRLLLALYLVSLTVIIYYIVKTQEENRRLEALKESLEHSLVTDALTKLGNRNAFQRDVEELYTPALILINIDRFKHINEFYGSQIGDRVLQEVALELGTIVPQNLKAKLYRLGGDDFGILFEFHRLNGRSLDHLLHYFHQTLEAHTIPIDDLEIDLDFTLGASAEKGELFETAGMALSHAKASSNQSYLVYDRSIDRRKKIAENITSIRHLRHALAEEHLLPYYQPIVSLKKPSQKKYEALARIEVLESGEVITPASFMAMARESKLSAQITDEILGKTLQIARENPDSIFSINLSTQDIEDPRSRRHIIQTIREHIDLAPRLVIEILESDEVDNYETVAEFIAEVKRYGCKIAIDDFGSGYSNFEKLLKMDIDMIKIDGSLITKIDHDRHSELIVRTILDFAKYAELETVAEFVHSKSIFEKVSKMGFDYAQGFYLGEPSRSLVMPGPNQISV